MSQQDDQRPKSLGTPQPLTEPQRQLLERFFMVNTIQRRVVQQLEDVLGPLAPYQQQRLFFHDVTGLIHFRRNFLETVGHFLKGQVDLTYQLTFIEYGSHRRRAYPAQHLNQIDYRQMGRGTIVETLNYQRLGCKIQRTYAVEGHHLYWEKNQIWCQGQATAWVDGLMALQQLLTPHTVWLQQGFLTINDYT